MGQGGLGLSSQDDQYEKESLGSDISDLDRFGAFGDTSTTQGNMVFKYRLPSDIDLNSDLRSTTSSVRKMNMPTHHPDDLSGARTPNRESLSSRYSSSRYSGAPNLSAPARDSSLGSSRLIISPTLKAF